jgi:hypothetical protein
MTINNERLAKFEGKCWHEVDKGLCKHCGKFLPDNPSYSTSPADRERLLEYLMEKKDMWDEFCEWAWKKNSEERVWNKVPWFVHWLTHPLDGTPRWVSLLSEFLGLEEVREKFGWEKCPNCDVFYTGFCTTCSGTSKIHAEWAKEE